MPSKKEYETVFNQILGTEMEWSRMTKEDLAVLAHILNHPKELCFKLGVIKGRPVIDFVTSKLPQGPVGLLLRKVAEATNGISDE